MKLNKALTSPCEKTEERIDDLFHSNSSFISIN